MINDLRYAFRLLLKSPGFSIIAVLTLAFGIGVNTAVFSLVHALLFQAPAYPARSDRAALLIKREGPQNLSRIFLSDVRDIRGEYRFRRRAGAQSP
jgi:hypothetical protein